MFKKLFLEQMTLKKDIFHSNSVYYLFKEINENKVGVQ